MKEQCRETLAMAVQILDGQPIPDEQRSSIEAHLNDCAPCFERLGLEREVKSLISRLKDSTLCPEHVRSRVLEMFLEEPSA